MNGTSAQLQLKIWCDPQQSELRTYWCYIQGFTNGQKKLIYQPGMKQLQGFITDYRLTTNLCEEGRKTCRETSNFI
jgi:hypothetical protein